MNINATLIGQSIAFFIFVVFCMKNVWPPMMAAIIERQKKIEDGLNAAEKAKADLASAEKDVEQELNKAKAKAASLVDQATKNANQMIEDAKAQAEIEAERIREQARSAVDQEINQAREALRKQVSELSVVGAEKILKEKVDVKTHAAMLASLAERL